MINTYVVDRKKVVEAFYGNKVAEGLEVKLQGFGVSFRHL